MTPHATEILRWFGSLNRALESKGFPAISPWWDATIRRWYETGKFQLVARVGRRGGKSSSICRLAVVEALYGQHKIPPGDVGVVAIVSARRPDALERLRTIKAILDAIGVPYIEKGDTVELKGRPVVFTVFTASIAGVSGFTGIFLFLDELAKWRDSETGANPAAVVIGSIRPTIATQPNARVVLSSSPMGLLDAHADAFGDGETALQTTAFAETWVANPTISEERTHQLEPDEVAWAREYQAIPQAEAETSHLSAALLQRNTRPTGQLSPDDRHTYVATIDPATRGNAWTLAIGTLSDNQTRRIVLTREWLGTKAKPLVPGAVFAEIATLIRPYRLASVHSDQFSEDTMRELARQNGLSLIVTPWTAGLKADAYDGLKTLAQETKLDLPNDPVVTTDLLGIRTKLTRNGLVFDLAKQGSRHSDFAPCIGMNVMLQRTPCTPLPMLLTEQQAADAFKVQFLADREKERKRAERRGPLPITHRPGSPHVRR
jgi:hypothetical protein